MRKIILGLVICFGSSSFSQNARIDCLKKVIKDSKSDKEKIETYGKIAGSFWNISWDSAKYYTNKSYDLSIKTNNKSWVLLNLISMATYEEINGDFKKSNLLFKKVANSLKNYKNDRVSASYYYNYGNLKWSEGKSDEAIINYEKAIFLYKILKNDTYVAKLKGNIAGIHCDKSEYSKSIDIYMSNLKYYIDKNDEKNYAFTLHDIGLVYLSTKEYKKALDYFIRAAETSKKNNIYETEASCYLNIGVIYGEMKLNSKSKKYINLSKIKFKEAGNLDKVISCDINYCNVLLAENKIAEAQKIVDKINIDIINCPNEYKDANKLIGLLLLKQNKNALKYFEEAYKVGIKTGLNYDLSEILSFIIESRLKNNKDISTLNNFKEYDSVIKLQNQIENKGYFFNLETKYRTAEKESQIKTQQLQIEQEKTNKYIAFGGIGFLILLSGGGFFWFKNQQKQKELQTQNTLFGLQQNLVEAELSSLNKQLDPHEIKNLLASISPEIQEKAPESYRKMLKLFNLTKASLNSNSITDSLENQLQQIDDFLSLEKSMLPIPFGYNIQNAAENTQTQIPRLLLKNLVENSIKHGIKHQETGGNIVVKVNEIDNFIYISVDDTGKGRNLAIALDSGIGTTTYQKLFATLNPKNKENATFEIIDKEQGTKVEVRIPVDYKYV